MNRFSLLLLSLVPLTAACGASKIEALGNPDAGSSPTGDGGGGGGGGSTPVLPGNLTPTDCADDNVSTIAGTWDVLGQDANGGTSTASLVIDASTFRFSASNKTLEFHTNGAAMTLEWTDAGHVTPITVSRTSSNVPTGALPLDLGGTWSFLSQTDSQGCGATLTSTSFLSQCNVSGTPLGTLKGSLSGTRTGVLASVFGELGGTWHLTADAGTIDVTVSGNTFHAVGTSTKKVDGTLDVKVCNGTASGVTSSGFEFAATRS